jgi:Cell division protein
MTRTLFRLFLQGVRDFSLNPLAQLFAFSAVTLVVFLSGLFLLVLVTLNHQLGTHQGETAFQVYWKQGAAQKEIEEQWSNFRNMPGFSQVKTYTPDQAFAELGKKLDRERGDLSAFPLVAAQKPLPATALIYFEPPERDEQRWLVETELFFSELPGVERVIATPLRGELGQAWRKASRYIMWPSVGLLGLVLALVVGNTIRLALVARAHEVEILQMVGAYNWYIRFPLVVGGVLQGLAGSLLALAFLGILHSQVKDALNFPPLLLEIQFLPLLYCFGLVLIPMLVGGLASYLAVKA